MKATVILEVIARYLSTVGGHNFNLEEDGLVCRGCGWNDAIITDEVDQHAIRCQYADKELILDNADPELLKKVGKWAVRTQKQIDRENARVNRAR